MGFLESIGLKTSAPLISGAVGLLGAKSQRDTNRKQIGLAQDQMDFQREMSNTAYQRAMADMKKAGINPIMVSKLGGASTPAGAMAQLKDPSQAGMQAINSASVVRQNLANTRMLEQEANYYDKKGYPKSVGQQAPLNIFLSEYLHKHPKEKDMLMKKLTQFITTANDPTKMLGSLDIGDKLKPSKPFDWTSFFNNDAFRPIITQLILKAFSSVPPLKVMPKFYKDKIIRNLKKKGPWDK